MERPSQPTGQNEDPVSVWLEELKNQDDSAAQKLWNHYVHSLREAARKRLRSDTRRLYDEDDATLSAFQSVCAGIGAGRFPDLQDRDSLWRLLVVITNRKVARRQRYHLQQRRDVRREAAAAHCLQSGRQDASSGIGELPSRELSPEAAAEFVDTCEHAFRDLADPALQQVAGLRLEGFTDFEIADQLKCSRRTIQRRLEVIRRRWERLEASND